MEISSELRIFKDAADNGYKIDVNRISELARQINPNASKVTLMSLLIPIVNIMGVLQRTMIYNNARHMILDQLSVMDSLIPMTKKEEEEYKQNPSTMNALFLNIKSQMENEPICISYTDGDERSTIWFKLENENPIIVKTDGPVSKFSLLEQRISLMEKWNNLYKDLNLVALVEELDSKKNKSGIIDLDKIKNKTNKEVSIPENQLSRSEKIEQLQELKSSMLNQETEKNISQEVASPQKTIKRPKK